MQRLNHTTASPEGYQKLLDVSAFLAHSGLEANLLELISMRGSTAARGAWTSIASGSATGVRPNSASIC